MAGPAMRPVPCRFEEVIIVDVGVITQLIANLGFPIACVVALFWSWSKEREDHKNEMSAMTEALNNNTVAITKIQTILDHLTKGE